MLSALKSRFSHEILPLLESIDCLSSPHITKVEKLVTLSKYYSDDVNNSLIVSEYRIFSRQSFPIHELHMVFLHMVQNGLTSVYPNLSILYRLVLTLPVTSASCERSFSALKFVKNNLRSVMGHQRLSDLMVMAVESERAQNSDLTKASDHFWTAYAERR